MELTKELEEKLKGAQTKEEVSKILEESGLVLDDEALDQVSGGKSMVSGQLQQLIKLARQIDKPGYGKDFTM